MAEEKVFLDERGVKVTNARFVTYSKTHALSGITSVSTFTVSPSKKGPIIVAVLGLIALAIKWWLGIILIAAGVGWFLSLKDEYQVVLSSSSGNEDALTDRDSAFIGRVVDALNEAIIHRG
ncbi:MAG TPA: QacE [Bacteroidales bacterium]|nr:MAG: hypothetical protein A2X11_03550 [Bacteroidetes bacterium GWE2_42_24]OFY32701.1 MAG: hypothetical protein A2X09_06570 [Bacteroidetes bacterium GWF2_43_11]PKP22356.1 MAG: QacE [Bacteroidetes bacterium HGW-Bacteroidetes-22]HAQ66141.1 QacE [Bacteroidales bacterium]HBZ65225.1 QacE [Bacteroidales bacterium]